MEGNFSLINKEFLERFAELKTIGETEYKVKKLWLEEGSKLVTNLREDLNGKFNNNTLGLPKYMTIENDIDSDVIKEIIDTKQNIHKELKLHNNKIYEKSYEESYQEKEIELKKTVMEELKMKREIFLKNKD